MGPGSGGLLVSASISSRLLIMWADHFIRYPLSAPIKAYQPGKLLLIQRFSFTGNRTFCYVNPGLNTYQSLLTKPLELSLTYINGIYHSRPQFPGVCLDFYHVYHVFPHCCIVTAEKIPDYERPSLTRVNID